MDSSAIRSLLDRARQGSHAALERLLLNHRSQFERAADARLGDALRRRVRPSDVLQSTFVDVVTSIEGFRGTTESEFAAWVVRILENNIRDAARYHNAGKRQRRSDSSGHDLEALELADPGPTPSAGAVIVDELVLIGRAMQKLPQNYNQILRLHMKPGQDHRATVRVIGGTENASRVLLARARAALAMELERMRGSA